MKITRISVYRVSLAAWPAETRYTVGLAADVPIETNVLRLDTDAGLIGWGESCTAPPYYYPTLSAGTREAIRHAEPVLLGADPRNVSQIMHRLHAYLRGHQPAKSAIDMALWDLAAKAAGLPLVELWGGRVAERLPVLAMICVGTAEAMLASIADYRAQGYRLFQCKVAQGVAEDDVARIRAIMADMRPGERCWFDANRAWSVGQAIEVMAPLRELAPLIEQPCQTYHECRVVSERTGLGLMLDESLDGYQAMLRAHADGVMDVATLKFNATGGISEQRFLAELGRRLRVPMRIEDFYGSGLTLAAVTHIAQSLPEEATWGLYDYHLPEAPVVSNPFPVRDGFVAVPADCAAGLGAEVDEAVLGEAVFELG